MNSNKLFNLKEIIMKNIKLDLKKNYKKEFQDYYTKNNFLQNKNETFDYNIYNKMIKDIIFQKNKNILNEINNDFFNKNGKMLRVKLGIKFNELFDNFDNKNNIKWILLNEILHNSSLIQDDILDNSKIRRNEECTYLKFGIKNASISPVFLVSKCGQELAKIGDLFLYKLYSLIISDLVEGEMIQKNLSLNLLINDIEKYKLNYMIKNYYKTGSLFANLLYGLGHLNNLNNNEKCKLIGLNLGLAFQIKDDLLDFDKTDNLDKETLKDWRDNVITYPIIILYEKCLPLEKKELWEFLNKKKKMNVDKLYELFDKYKIMELTENIIYKLFLESINELNQLNIINKNKLFNFINFSLKLIKRNN